MASPAGAFGELIDECAVQYGKGLEALRVREANEQLQAEVCACWPLLRALSMSTSWCSGSALGTGPVCTWV